MFYSHFGKSPRENARHKTLRAFKLAAALVASQLAVAAAHAASPYDYLTFVPPGKSFQFGPPTEAFTKFGAKFTKRSTPKGRAVASRDNPSSGGSSFSFGSMPLIGGETAAMLVYHVRSGTLELNGKTYSAASGNKEGFNNPALEALKNTGPVPVGEFNVTNREGSFFGERAWRIVGNIPFGRRGFLIHSDAIGVRGDPRKGASLGCIAVDRAQYHQLMRDMELLKPTRIRILSY